MAKRAKKPVSEEVVAAVTDTIEPCEVELQKVQDESPVAVQEAPAPVVETPKSEVALTYDVKLSIYEKRILDVPAGTAKVVVENLGGGDLYVDANAISYSSNALIAIGASKEFSGVSKLFVSSASRPTFRVSIFK
jgi:hypothetical protein